MPREEGEPILTLQEAVRKMTSFPAQKLRLMDRGLLREGMWADITILDLETITDQATYTEPHQYPKGIPYVIVNGKVVIEREEHTGELPGKVLRSRK
jgi:N-acyl-D-aspartate/D-glutamate deacylase